MDPSLAWYNCAVFRMTAEGLTMLEAPTLDSLIVKDPARRQA